MSVSDDFPGEQVDGIMEQVAQSAVGIEGTLTSVKFSINDGALCISTEYIMNEEYNPEEGEPEAEPPVDEVEPEPVYVSTSGTQSKRFFKVPLFSHSGLNKGKIPLFGAPTVYNLSLSVIHFITMNLGRPDRRGIPAGKWNSESWFSHRGHFS